MKTKTKTIKGLLATDKNRKSYIYDKQPEKCGNYFTIIPVKETYMYVGKNFLGQTWNDEPWPVSIKITKKE